MLIEKLARSRLGSSLKLLEVSSLVTRSSMVKPLDSRLAVLVVDTFLVRKCVKDLDTWSVLYKEDGWVGID